MDQFGYISIQTNDVDKTADFYIDNFGFKKVKRYEINENGEETVLQFIKLGNTLFEIFSLPNAEAGENGPFAMIGIYVDDIKYKLKELKEKNVEIIDDIPWEGSEEGQLIAGIRGINKEQIMLVEGRFPE